MASKLSLITGVLKSEVNDLTGDLFSSKKDDGRSAGDDVDPVKARKDEAKKEEAQRQYDEERRKKREKQEYQREKVRDGIRQKYGIEKKTHKKQDSKAIEEVKKDYNMSEAEFAEFQQRVQEDDEVKANAKAKIDAKLEHRAKKKEIKKNVKDSCKTQ